MILSKIGSLIPVIGLLHNNIRFYFNRLSIKLPDANPQNFLKLISGILLAPIMMAIIESTG
jgi:hypothetical protein